MKFRNKYYIMRHGQAKSNVLGLCSCWPEEFNNPLTTIGKKTVKSSAENLKDKNISLIFNSPLKRTKMTAEIAGKILKITPKPDKRLREIGFGIFNNKTLGAMWKHFKTEEERINERADGGETYAEILDRMLDFLREIDEKYAGRNILIVSHEGPLFLLQGKVMSLTIKETIKRFPTEKRIHKAEIRELN
jgi:broad specificity phosphatase PhoE